jgi:hypothetical protein
MPTPTGGETIVERLERFRADLARVRATIARAENNGGQWAMGGMAVTEIAYERAVARAARLEAAIVALEARLSGSAARSGLAQLQTKMD